MATVKFKFTPGQLPKLSPAQRKAQDALTSEQITAAAQTDPDNPPLTEEELDRLSASKIANRSSGWR